MKHYNSFNKLLLTIIACLVVSISVYADDEAKHVLKVVSKPAMAGTFNTSSASLSTGEVIRLYAYANSNFSFKEWRAEDGTIISTAQNFDYAMPAGNATLTAVYDYNPANPANPAINAWYPLQGSAIIDDFAVGSLSKAITNAIGNSKSSDVQMITVAGVMNTNDFNVANNFSNCALLDISRVTGVAEVPSYAFDYTNLETVYLPASIEKIGARAFYSCTKLQSLTIYAMTPPTLESNVFQGVQEGLVVYAPAAAIAQYQDAEGWKNFTILPIQEDIRSLSVSLPDGASANDYSQMWLELTNTKSGQKMHYVMTDRTTYSFSNIIRNTSWNVVLRNQRGDVFGKIDNIEVKDEDVNVTFPSLSKPQNVTLAVKTPDGNDVTTKTQVTWLDADGNYLAQSTGLSGLIAGYAVGYRVMLSQDLAMQYVVPQQKNHVVSDSNNNLTLTLEPIKQVVISGCVKDAKTNTVLSGATVTASQTFGGKYSKTVSTKTDAKGNYALTVSSVPTSIAVSASDYISQTVMCDQLMTGGETVAVPDIALKEISGAVISIGLTYTNCPTAEDDEETFQNWYADYNNVAYSIFNKTKQRTVSQFNVQYPQIVLLEEVEEGDVLELTATSKTNAFMPVKTSATIDAEQHANATFGIVELGKIKSTFVKNSNATVVGSLYDANGKLVKSYDYNNATLTINDLVDGSYTLVTMGSSKLFNSIYDLSQLPQTGLVLGSDYTQTSVEVKSGKVCSIDIAEVPTLDESKLYYTGDNTSFTVNKSSIVAGNYLTLTGHLDFKPTYASNVSNVNLIVDLPESCEFVENSVMVGNSTSSYTLDGHRLTVPMARYTDRVRFCIIPTRGGDYAPSALAQFDIDGETVTQPIGSANYTAKDLSINVPKTVAKTTIPISGTAIGTSTVEIYDGSVLIGQTTSLANGTWSATCELNTPYNLSMHNIYAKVTTKAGLELQSDTKSCFYDKNAIEVKTVEMSFYNGWLHRNVSVLFDFQNNNTSSDSYMFYTATDFTFLVDFTDNDPEKMKCVDLYVYTTDNEVVHLLPVYNKERNCYVASRMFSSNSLPTNVDVRFVANTNREIDRQEVADMYKQCVDIVNDRTHYNEIEAKYNELLYLLEKNPSESNKIIEEIKDLLNISNIKISLSDSQKERYDKLETIDEAFRLAYEITLDEKYKCGEIDETLYDYYNSEAVFEAFVRQKGIFEDGIIEVSEILPSGIFELPKALYLKVDCPIDVTFNDLAYLQCHVIDENNAIITNEKAEKAEHIITIWISDDKVFSKQIGNDFPLQSTENKPMRNIGRSKETDMLSLASALTGYSAGILETAFAKTSALLAELGIKGAGTFSNMSNMAKTTGNICKYAGVTAGLVDVGIESYKTSSVTREWDDIINFISGSCIGDARTKYLDMASKYQNDYKKNKFINQWQKTFWTVFGMWPPASLGAAIGGFTQGKYDDLFNQDIEDSKNYIISAVSSDRSCKPFPNYLENLLRKGINPIHDPSGFVYEGVFSNRLEGVTATAYYKEMVEDMYGDLHENIVKWDAEEYAQENPLFTDENGYYRWDVPQGMWQVKFEKEGYETTYSDWLPVPPPQLDVNIAMKQNVQPNVKNARAYEDAVEVEFDKYMMPELLNTDNIIVVADGKQVEGSVELLNEEVKCEGETETFASKLRFNAAEPFEGTEITLMVNNRVKSYAGIRMQDDYSQSFTIEQEIRKIECESETVVRYGNTTVVPVSVLPASASAGKTVTVRNSSSMILGTDVTRVVLDDNGKAEIAVSGELPGTAALTFSIEGYDLSATTIVNVVDADYADVTAPVASIASGTTVEKGTKITLSCPTKGVTIYYTLDGSCPCDEQTRIVYTEPIIINESVTIKAMAVAEDMTESDIVEFTYIVDKGNGIDDVTIDESLKVYPLPVRDKLNVTAGGKIIKSVTLVSMSGSNVVSASKPVTHVTIDVSSLTPGIYIINVATEDKTYSRKIMKVE